MFTMLLVPLDGSTRSEMALGYALKLGSRLHLMQAVATRPTPCGYGRTVSPEARQRSEAYLRKLVRKLERPGLTLSWSVEEAEQPSDAIVACAQEVRATAIVMMTQGRTGLGRLLLGSVTERVTRRSPCPVLSARPEVAQKQLQTSLALRFQHNRSRRPRALSAVT